MKLADRISLAKAGYTRKEIKAFEDEQTENSGTGNASTDPVEVIADGGNADPTEETPESAANNLDVLPKIFERLTALENNRVAANIANAQMPEFNTETPEEAMTKFFERMM